MGGSPLTLDDVAAIGALAAAAPHPLAILDAIGTLALRTLEARGFTMFRYLPRSAQVERLHSSDPVAYPVGGRKRIADYPTNQAALARGDVFVARDRDEVRRTYRDHETIFALGVTSIMNVPVRFRGLNIGAVNVLGREGQFGEPHTAVARVLAALMVPALLTWDDGQGAPWPGPGAG